MARASRISEAWRIWLAGAEDCLQNPQLDLAQFEFAQGRMDRWNLRAWRLPVALAIGLLLVQIIGMNIQWLLLRNEAKRVEAAQADLLHTAFPNVPQIAEPPLLMRRRVEQLRTASGRSVPGDFLPLADGFARGAQQLPPDALLALEYRAGTLYVTLKPGTNTGALRNAVRQTGLQMEEDKESAGRRTRRQLAAAGRHALDREGRIMKMSRPSTQPNALAARFARLKPRVPERWRERFDAFWNARNPREQAILGGSAVLLVLVFGYLLLWEPAADGRARLNRNLPQMRADLAEMETLAQEARGLAASPAPTLRGDALTQALQDKHGPARPETDPAGADRRQCRAASTR